MNAEVKKKWAETLRSGKYIQGRRYLSPVNKKGERIYCCLGVLCELYQQEEGNGEWKSTVPVGVAEPPLVHTFTANYRSSTTLPPPVVLDWAGLTETRADELAIRNDQGTEFVKLADIIERDF